MSVGESRAVRLELKVGVNSGAQGAAGVCPSDDVILLTFIVRRSFIQGLAEGSRMIHGGLTPPLSGCLPPD